MLTYINAIVEDEVVAHLPLAQLPPAMQESMAALFSSEPRFVLTAEMLPVGSTWNGTDWVAPVE